MDVILIEIATAQEESFGTYRVMLFLALKFRINLICFTGEKKYQKFSLLQNFPLPLHSQIEKGYL